MKQLLLLFAMCFSLNASADVGLTHELREKRNVLLNELTELQADTGAEQNLRQQYLADSLKSAIIELDGRLFKSQQESIDRLSANQRANSDRYLKLTWLALASVATALVVLIFFLASYRKLSEYDRSTGFRSLLGDLLYRVTPVKASGMNSLRINIVVVIGLLLMSVSVFAYLLEHL